MVTNNGNGTRALARRRNVDRLFSQLDDDFLGIPLASSIAGSPTRIENRYAIHIRQVDGWTPAVDLLETGTELVLRVDVPGIKTGDLEITLENDMLLISGKREIREEQNESRPIYSERCFGTFSRCITLPSYVDANAIEATQVDGELTVRLKKRESATPKQIPVTSG